MISMQQMRAARGLMNWSQAELARRCGLSVTAMNNIDRGHSVPRVATLEHIRRVFESEGVEFTPGQGVRLRDEVFQAHFYEGDNAILDYFNDIIETIKSLPPSRREALHIMADERSFLTDENVLRQFFSYYQVFKKQGGTERVLLAEGTMERYGPPSIATYRWCSKEVAGQVGSTVCGDKYYVFLKHRNLDRIVTIENPSIAEAYRKQFKFQWSRARPMPPVESVYEKYTRKNSVRDGG